MAQRKYFSEVTPKINPADDDIYLIADSEDLTGGNPKHKKITHANLKAGIVIDEDNFASDLADKAPSQQSTKAYIATEIAGKADTSHTHTASEITDFDTEVSNNSDVVANTAKNTYPSADATKVGHITVTQAVDLDQIETDSHTHSNKALLDATTASYTTAEETKLSGIETGADVTDTENVTAAGALMDSEVTSLSGIKTLTVPDTTTISTFGASLVDDLTASDARTTLGAAASSHTHAASDIASGTLADARVAESNVTQHEAALTITESQISDLGSYAASSHTHTHADITDYDTELAGKTNTTAFTPTADYHPATKKYVDDTVAGGGGPGGPTSELSDLSDVNTSTPTNRNVLVADGVDWESRALEAADIQSGAFDNSLIAVGNVTQHQASLSITESQISDLGTYVETGTANTFTATQTFADVKINTDKHAYFTSVFDNGTSGTADTIDWGVGNIQKSTINRDCTYTFTDPDGPGSFQLIMVQGDAIARTPTRPVSVKRPSGTAPTLTTADGSIDIISFTYDGTNYYGVEVLNFS